MTASAIRSPEARALQGNRAGIVSRVIADGIDYLIVFIIYFAILVGLAVTEYLLTGHKFKIPDPPVAVTIVVPWLILVGYLTAGWGGTGRTFGKTVMGLRVGEVGDDERLPDRTGDCGAHQTPTSQS